MRKIFLIIFSLLMFMLGNAQNSIGVQIGFLGTHTSAAEYLRQGRNDYLLDSVTLDRNIGSFQAAINADIDLGKHFFMSTGFHYEQKGFSDISFTDLAGKTYSVKARQNYIGLSFLIQYRVRFKNKKFGMLIGTGPKIDFAVGTPNNGALYSGAYTRFFMPFSRYNETDLSWATELGGLYQLGPGNIVLKVSYLYGLSDVLEDAYIIGRTQSIGISIGYSIPLTMAK